MKEILIALSKEFENIKYIIEPNLEIIFINENYKGSGPLITFYPYKYQ